MLIKDERAIRDALFYNLLPHERDLLRLAQNNLDPITGEELKPYAHLDHDHKTGLIRGLLNPMTNKFLRDDIALLEASIRYLKNPPAIAAFGGPVYGLIGKAQKKKKMLYGPDGTPEPQPRSNDRFEQVRRGE